MSILSLSESNLINSMLKNPNEDFQKVIGLIEEKLKQSEEKYRTLIEGLTQTEIGVDIIDLNHNIIYQNDFLRGRFGYHNGRKCYEHYLGRENSCKICPVEKAINTNKVEKETIITPENRIYEITSAPLPDKDGKVDRAAEVIIDITERRQIEADLKREKLFIEEALNAQRDTFFVFEPSSGKAIRWNKAFGEISGYSDEEILAMRAPDSYYDEKSLQRAADATRIIEEKSTSYVQMDLITKDGNSIPFEYNGSNITDEEGNLKYIVSIGRNITDRKKAEQIIEESEFNLKKAQEMAHIGHWKLNIKTEEVLASDELYDIFGLSHKEVTLNAFAEIVHPDDREYDLYHIRRGMEEGIPWDIEHRLICKDGIEKWIHAIGDPTKDETGKIISILGTVQDVTERKKIEHELKNSEEKFRNITEQSLMSIYILQDGLLKYRNQRAVEVSGYSREETKSWEPYEYEKLIHPEDRELVLEQSRKKQEGGTDVINSYQYRIINKSGVVVWLENFSKTINYMGAPADLVITRDITEKIVAEQKLKESEEKFRNIAEQFLMGIGILQDEVLIYANLKLANMYGYTVEEFIGKKYSEFLNLTHPDDRTKLIGQVERRKDRTRDTMVLYQIRAFKKTGELFWVNIYSRIITYQGKRAGLLTVLDITDMKKAELKLKESEENFRTMTEDSHLAITILQDDLVVYTNQQMADLFGYDREEMLTWTQKEYTKTVAEDSLEFVMEQATKKQTGDPDVTVHYPIHSVKSSGEKFWVDNISTTIMYKGRPADLVTIIDITEKRKAEQLLKESEEKYRSLFENSPVALIDQDYSEMKKYIDHLKATGIKDFKKYFEDYPKEVLKFITKVKIIDVNRKTLEVYKFNTKEHFISRMNKLGESLENNMAEEVFLDNKREILALINGDTMYESELSSTTSLGDNMNLYAKTSIVSGFESTWSKVIVSILDITEQKNAEKNLRESEEKYRNLVETSSMGLLEIDFSTKELEYINPKLLSIIGYTYEELSIENLFQKFIHPEDLMNLDLSEEERKLEFRVVAKDGKIKWLSGNKLHSYDENGNLTYLRLWLQDITEQKELEQIKTNLLIRFSHEFKTPLISIKGFADLLIEEYQDKLNEKIVSFLEKIKVGANALNSLTNKFIESSQLDENIVRLNISPVKITKLINRVLFELEGVTKSRQQIIDLKIKENLVINCDLEKLFTIISNLLLNAAKFTPQGGLIIVSIATENEFVIISIKDNGIGLNNKELEKLFKPFGKIERYGQGLDIVPDGMGMGLFITKELVRLHKGTIWAESAGRNKGSIFNVKIPLNLQN